MILFYRLETTTINRQNSIFKYKIQFINILSCMQKLSSQKTKVKQNSEENDDLDTLDSRSEKGSRVVSVSDTAQNSKSEPKNAKEEPIKETKPETKEKSKGFFGFINEKLNEWPLWMKLTSKQKNKEEIKKEQVKKNVDTKGRTMNCPFIPWEMFMDRSLYKPVYLYYHNKEEKITYFFRTKKMERKQQHQQIFEMPSDEIINQSRIIYTMPMEKAIEQMENNSKLGFRYF